MSGSRADASRLSDLRRELKKERLSALLVTGLPNVRYLTGFSGSSGALLVERREAHFLTDSRYLLQAGREVRGCRIVELHDSLPESLAALLGRKRPRRVGFESRHISWALGRDLAAALPRAELVATEGKVETLRMTKDAGEVALLRRAVRTAGEAYTRAARVLAGRTEEAVAAGLETAMRFGGAEAVAFPPIVASGRQGALPHATPGRRRIRGGALVVIDFGARFRGYHSDITRSRLPGKRERKAVDLYRIVAEAQRRAIAAVRPGVRARAVDEAARTVIAGAGFGDCFGHGVGHGVGLEVHEAPTISPRSGDVLEEGMVFTVEPGIYVENFGGVRIEDMVLVTESGCEVLTRSIPRPVL